MNKLTKYILWSLGAAICIFIAWYFSSILVYIIISAVIAMIGKPLVKILTKIKIKKFSIPNWLASIITISLIATIFLSIFLIMAPIMGTISSKISQLDFYSIEKDIDIPLNELNEFFIKTFPTLGADFRIEMLAFNEFKNTFDISMFSNIVNSLATFLVDFSVASFSIIFISFFFLMEEGSLTRTILVLFPDKYSEKIKRISDSTSNLLTRYFIGISIESLGITTLNAIGLIFIAGFDTSTGILIAFATGILNIIPYVGPLIGHVLALITGGFLFIGADIQMGLGLYLIVIFAITMTTQLIDNYVFQPLIYSSSVKAHPLEIFIVILIAGSLAGAIGMIVAVPCYTVIRIIAAEFLSQFKIVQELTKNL